MKLFPQYKKIKYHNSLKMINNYYKKMIYNNLKMINIKKINRVKDNK